jgi:hypothetical protein
LAIKAKQIGDARAQMPPVTHVFIIDGEEREETLRLHRRVVSPKFRRELEAREREEAAAKAEQGLGEQAEETPRDFLVDSITLLDVQSPDILGADDRPERLTRGFWEAQEDIFLVKVWESHQASRELPNATTSSSTNSGS